MKIRSIFVIEVEHHHKIRSKLYLKIRDVSVDLLDICLVDSVRWTRSWNKPGPKEMSWKEYLELKEVKKNAQKKSK